MAKLDDDLELLNPRKLFSDVFIKINGNPSTFANEKGQHFVQGARGEKDMQMIMHIVEKSMTIILNNPENGEIVAKRNNEFLLDDIETIELLTEVSKGIGNSAE